MTTIKPYLFTLLTLFFTSTVFFSCSNEDVETDQNLESNLQAYVSQTVQNSEKIFATFKVNKNVKFDIEFKNKLKSSKTVADAIKLLNNSGIENSDIILNLVKEQIFANNNFKKSNPTFYKLDEATKAVMIEKIVNDILTKKHKVKSVNKIANNPDCVEDYQNDVQDCNDDAIRNSAFAIIAAGAGIWPGLLGAAATMAEYTDCRNDSARDYLICESRSPCSRPGKHIKF